MRKKTATPVWEDLFAQLSEPPASNEELERRVADLEWRMAAHNEILNFLKTILYQLR